MHFHKLEIQTFPMIPTNLLANKTQIKPPGIWVQLLSGYFQGPCFVPRVPLISRWGLRCFCMFLVFIFLVVLCPRFLRLMLPCCAFGYSLHCLVLNPEWRLCSVFGGVAATISALSSDSDVGSLMVAAISNSICISPEAVTMFLWAIIWLFGGYVFLYGLFGVFLYSFGVIFGVLPYSWSFRLSGSSSLVFLVLFYLDDRRL